MHRLFAPFLAIAVMLAVLAPAPGHATDADTKGVKLQFDAAVLQRMSAFVSAFAEVDAQGLWHRIDAADQADPKFLINFGVRHNWMHKAASFAVADGRASIDATIVAATIGEYFGLNFTDHASVPEAGIDFVGGKYVIAADTPREGPQAVVANVYATPNNELLMLGHVAGKQAEDGPQVGQDDLQVRVAHQQWQGKDCWKLLAWLWAGKPEAKPEATPAELPEATPQPVEKPTEQPDAQPAEQPEGQPVEAAPAVQPAEQTIDKPCEQAVEQPEATPEAQPVQESAPAVEPEAQTEAQPAPQPEPVSVPESGPATAPEAQPVPEVIPAPQPEAAPVAEAAPAMPVVPAEPAVPETTAVSEDPARAAETADPATTSELVAQTIIPFTASTEPDFSSVLAIAVPAGWNHRNAEGVLELTTEAQDAWLVVEAARLGKRDPQKALKVFSGGAVLTPYGDSGASYVFTSEGSTGPREHMIVVDADANLVCRLTWQASEVHRDAIAAILHGLRVNGRAVAS